MKKKILKVLALVACAVLLVVGSIAGTLAYMTSTATVKNTFTVGNVTITMDEAKVDEYGVAVTPATRVTENTYKLIPNHTYVKDPKIVVKANSEACYVFVKVENGIAAIEGGTTIANQMTANGWMALTGVDNVYYYQVEGNGVVASATADKEIPVFASFKIGETVKNDDLTNYEGAKVVVTAYAVQADGFADAAAAWAATFGASNG